MSVLDASVVVDLLLGGTRTEAGAVAASEIGARTPLAAPDLLDIEVAQVLRRYVLRGEVAIGDARAMVDDLVDLPIDRYPSSHLVGRAFAWYANVTVYDGVYLALAEALDRPLLTGDARLAAVPGCSAAVSVLSVNPLTR